MKILCLPVSGQNRTFPLHKINLLRAAAFFFPLINILSWNVLLQAQLNNVTITHVGSNEGLSQNSVYQIYQDSRGFMWLGTGNGLNRFDGYQFMVYKNNPEDSSSLKGSLINGLTEDDQGNLWIVTEYGLNRYDRFTGKFMKAVIRNPSNDYPKLLSPPIACRSNHLFFSNGLSELISYNTRNGYLKTYSLKHSTVKKFSYLKTLGGSIWYLLEPGYLMKFDPSGERMSYYKCPVTFTHGALELLGEIKGVRRNQLLFLSDNGFEAYDTLTGRVNKLDAINPFHYFRKKGPTASLVDTKGNVWIAVQSELGVFDSAGHLIKLLITDSTRNQLQGGYSFANILVLCEDRSGNIWVGTDIGGAYKINFSRQKFEHHCIVSGQRVNLSGNFIKCFWKDESNELYVGTYAKGLNIVNENTGAIKHYLLDRTAAGNIDKNTISVLFQDKQKNCWVGTQLGLYLFDKIAGQFRAVRFPPAFQRTTVNINCVYQRETGEMLAGTNLGLFLINKRGPDLHASPIQYSGVNTRQAVRSIIEDRWGTLWISFALGGALHLSKTGEAVALFGQDSSYQLDRMVIRCFLEDRGDVIWAATNNGLLKINPDGAVLKKYSTQQGLPDDYLYGLLSDSKGNLWISSNKGLSMFNPQREVFRNYTIEDGLQSYEFNTGAYYKDRNGKMYFGGINGYNCFYPEKVHDNLIPPSLVLNDIRLFNWEMELDTVVTEKRLLKLSYNQNTLSFELAALEYTNPINNQYAYRLAGLEENWNNLGKQRHLYFVNLKPGTYTLWARAANGDGIWSSPRQLLTIVITPPLWQQWWFILLELLTLGGGVGMAVYYISTRRLRKKLLKLEQQREIENVRRKIGQDIHDDIGSGLSRMLMLSELAKKDALQHSAGLQDKLGKLSASARELMSNLSEIVWATNPKNDTLPNLFAYIRSYLTQFFEEQSISCHIQFPGNIPDIPVSSDFRRNLFLLLKECLNNIAKHAHASRVEIELIFDEKVFHLIITDNGKGMGEGNLLSKGNGLTNMKQRAEELGGTFKLESSPDRGSRMSFEKIPYKNTINMRFIHS